MITLRVFDEAERELEHEAIVYQRERPGWGDKFMDEYEAIVARALQLPHSGTLVGRRGQEEIRKFLFKRFRHTVITVLRKDVLYVVAVAPQSKRPWYWVKRLAKIRP